MRSKQKKYKFSKGEVNPKLLERQDLEVLESSASYIKNLVSTPFGSIKTRQGTECIDKVATNITPLVDPTITTNIGGTAANLWNDTAMFLSTGTDTIIDMVSYDFAGALDIYKIYVEEVSYQKVNPSVSAVITDGVITGISISNGGIGINNPVVTITDIRGSGADVTATVNSAGTITGFTIVDGGALYSSRTRVVIESDEISETVLLQGSLDGVAWTTIDTYTITDVAQDLVTTVNASYRYIRLLGSGTIKSKLSLYYMKCYSKSVIDTSTKIVDFVFNLSQKYLLVLRNELIDIYENDVKTITVTATGLLAEYFENIKVTQAEDTMIFTHPNMQTKQLQRSFKSQAFTNDPAAGANIVLNMAATGSFVLNDVVMVSSSIGSELATVTNVVSNTSITVNALTLDHTLTNPKVTSTTRLNWTFSSFPFEFIEYGLFGSESKAQPAQTLTPSAVEGSVKLTAGGAVFSAGSVGQLIDGGGGRVRITQYESTTIVYGYTIIPFYTTAAIASGTWDYITGYEPVWSSVRGWPSTCMFFDQRLWFGGSKDKPNTFWGSRIGQYNSFENVANYDNDSISATIASEQIDEIVNIYANRGIQVFTVGAEWIVPESTTTPDSITVSKNTSNGSLGRVDPVDIAGTTLFIERNGNSLLSFVYTEGEAAYVTASLSLLTDMISSPYRMAVDYNSDQDVGNFLYIVNDNGKMAVACILLDQQINSFVRFETDGLYKDVVNVAGDTYVLVERKDRVFLEKFSQVKCDCVVEDSTLSDNITGLDDFNGYYVRAYTNTTNYGTYFVMGGEITLSDVPTETVYIGIDFDYELISNKVAINGQTENIEKRIAKATLVSRETNRITFCGQTMSQTDDVYDFYGVTGFARDCRFTITGTFDYIEVLSIMLNLNYGDK